MMENKKTIEYLNGTAWYRAVKVIYILSFVAVFALIIVVFSTEGDFDVLDIQNSKIVCQYGNEKIFLVKDIFDTGKILAPNNYDLHFTTDDENRIREFCEIDQEKLLAEGVWRIGENGRIEAEVFDSGIYGGVAEYRIEKERKKNWGSLLLGLLVTVAIFEAIKRIFYYIVLGRINPKK